MEAQDDSTDSGGPGSEAAATKAPRPDQADNDEHVDWEKRLSTAEAALQIARDSKARCQQQIQELQGLLATFDADIARHQNEVRHAQLQVPCQWNDMYYKLVAYKARFGDVLVPHTWKEDPSLGRFVGNQRVFYKYYQNGDTKHIKPHRIDALNRLGFVWNVKEHQYQLFVQQLVDYKTKHGHFNVPSNFPENQKFSNWVITQRVEYSNLKRGLPSSLTPERVQQLEGIKFNWISPKKEHLLKLKRGEVQHKNKSRAKKRKRKVEETETEEPTADEFWDRSFASLQTFHRHHGHCQVNKITLTDEWKKFVLSHDLIAWTAYQRRQKLLSEQRKECFIDADKIRRLDELQFPWTRPLSEPRKNTATKKRKTMDTLELEE